MTIENHSETNFAILPAIAALREHGGRMTRRQWIGATCLLKLSFVEEIENCGLIRKTKRHVLLVNPESAP